MAVLMSVNSLWLDAAEVECMHKDNKILYIKSSSVSVLPGRSFGLDALQWV